VLGTGAFQAVRAPFGLTRGRRERALGEALVAAAQEAGCDVTVGIRHLPRVDLYWPHAGSHAAALRGQRSARAGRLLAPEEVPVSGRHRSFLEMERGLLDGGGARRIACVSNLVLRELAAAYPRASERLVHVPDGVDTERFHPRGRGTDSRIPFLGFSARQPELKGLRAIFEALAGMLSRPWMLLVTGPRDGARWEKLAGASGLPPDRVCVVPEMHPVAFASGIDILLHPTWRDACGLVVLEALACGTPVVTTAQAGAAEVITSEEQGTVLHDPGDVAALRSAIADRLSRLGSEPVDREKVRSAVLDRDRATWLAALESILLDLAARRAV